MQAIVQHILTPVGMLAARWTDNGLYSCEFRRTNVGEVESRHSQEALPGSNQQQLWRSIRSYFATGDLQWNLDELDWRGVSVFAREVLVACSQIPAGQTRTYGQLALAAGRPKAARAVGGAMARNRWPIVIPCHRVVGGKGNLTGYSGTGGLATKQALLDLEQS